CWANYTRRRRWTSTPDDLNDAREISDETHNAALATLLFASAVIPSADARVVQPPWVVLRWSYGDCKIWRNDTGPWYPGWQALAYANTYPEAWAKMQTLYGRRWCI